MTLYLVTVLPGIGRDKQYFDSIWVRKEAAESRSDQLRQEFRRVGFEMLGSGTATNVTHTAWAVKVTSAECLDGQIDKPKSGNL